MAREGPRALGAARRLIAHGHHYPSREMSYTVTTRLGRGGTGVVDLATDARGRSVALKRLALHGSAQEMERARQRIRREAEVLAQLDHPGIVRLLDVVDEGDEVVLVMPYMSGGTLSDRIRHHGPMSADEVAALADHLLSALAAAHRQGVVHRDIKPANILFDDSGAPCITDFGTATARDITSGLTATGMIIGTPEYMAPEQARGEPAGTASDMFSLGATLRYAATGTPPFGRGDPAVILRRAAKGRVDPWPDHVDSQLRRRLSPMLRREPDRRPSAATAAGGPAGTEILRRARPGRLTAVVAAGAAVLVVAVAAVALIAGTRSRGTGEVSAEPQVAETETSTPCSDLPYQPCGSPVAPFTDGVRCVANHADYDGDPANGCEAAPDTVDGSELIDQIAANLVPVDDVDRYPFHVKDEFQLFCNGQVKLTLTAPVGVSMRLDVLEGTRIIATEVSSGGRPAVVTLDEPNCFDDDTTDLVARVSWVGESRSAQPYQLTRSGSW